MKKVKVLIWSLFVLFCASIIYAQSIATVYSDFSNKAYKNVLVDDLTKQGFTVTPYENIEFKKLSENFNKYNVIIFNSGYNYTNSVDLATYAPEMKAYLEAGGLMIVTDANYPMQNEWISSIDKELFWHAGSKKSDTELSAADVYAKDHPLLKLKTMPTLPWCSVDSVSRSFNALLTDKKGIPVLAYKEIGKGILVVSSSYIHYGFPSVEFINNLINWQKDENRLKNLGNSDSNSVKEKPDFIIFDSRLKIMPQVQHMYSAQGNSNVDTDITGTFDTNGINFQFVCYDKDIINATATAGYRDGPIWNDDSVEIFIMPHSKTYYHFGININNIRLDQIESDPSYDCYWTSDVKVEKDKWILNVHIPYTSIGINKDNPPSKEFRVNFGRTYHPGKPLSAVCSWAYLPIFTFHNTDFFGTMKVNGNISYEKYTFTKPLEINMPAKIQSGKNSFSVNDNIYNYEILDLCCGAAYNSEANKSVEVDLKKAGKHQLQALLFDNDKNLLASSKVYTVDVPEILKVITKYPYYRNIVQSKDPDKNMLLECIITDAMYKDLVLEYSINGQDKVIIKGKIKVKQSDIKNIKYDLSKLKEGSYTYTVNLKSKDKVIKTYKQDFKVLAPADYEVTFDQKRVCYVNGKPFFPILLYHSGEYMMNVLNQSKLPSAKELEITSMLKDINDHGFNGAITQFPYEVIPERYITNTHNANMEIIPEYGLELNKDRLTKNIAELNKYKAGLFYYTVDEPIGERLKGAMDVYKLLEELDPHRPIGAAVNHAAVFKDAAKAFDIMMPDEYVIRHAPLSERRSISGLLSHINAAMEATDYQKPLWAVPQGFGNHDTNSPFGIPVPEELRCQAYFYLIYGATGFAWYAYTSPEADPVSEYRLWHLPSTNLWEAFKVLNKEISQFSEVIIKGDSKGPLKTNNEFIHSNYWQIGKTSYIILVNPERTQKTATIDLPKSADVTSYFENKKINYKKINSKQIEITFEPLECVILKTK